ncbi:MAG TPA: hypothetical protein VGX02_00105 [Candidatus Eremiobacteraceae bacterium]|nr:hypothetical protein [Candidatus Eremiobacteraceae bacterium]
MAELSCMAKILLLQFHSDSHRKEHYDALKGLGAELVEAEPRWPSFFDVLNREHPDVVVISLGAIPSHGREAARYIKDGFNSRNLPVFLTDVPAKGIDKSRKSAPGAIIVEQKDLHDAVYKKLMENLAGKS